MKLLLLFKPNLKMVNDRQNVVPNGLLYIGAELLSKNIDTDVLNLGDKSWEECREIIKNKAPDVVGISCYTFNRHTCIKLAKIVKEVNENIKVVFGGPHASIMYMQLFKNSKDIDVIVFNEGEITFLELISNLQNNKPLKDVSGIVYRKDNEIINNGFRHPLEELDKLPIAANYFKYKRIVTSRGCPGKCIFCGTPSLWGQRVRLRSVNNVVDELELLNKKYGISSFSMTDDVFTFDKNRTIEICREIIKRNLKITWSCTSRVNVICAQRLRWMKKAGCVAISYGIESGSQKILNNLKKGINVEQIRKAAALTRKFGLNLIYFIIIGTPGETDDTIRETMRLIKETKPTAIFTFIMQLTPGTALYKMAKQDNFVKDIDWIDKEDETIFYTHEKKLEVLAKYARYINEFFNLFKTKFQYSEEELNNIMKEGKGVQDLINLAHIKTKEKKTNEAEKIIDEALILNSGSSEALMNKAIFLAMGKDEKCIDFFNSAIKADPENLSAYKNLGLFLFKEKKYNEAINVFKKGIEIEPADIEFYNNLGSIYGTQEEYDKAVETFEKALSINPNNKGTINNLIITLEKKKFLLRKNF